MRQRGALVIGSGQAPPAVHFAAQRNIGHAKVLALHKGVGGQVLVQPLQHRLHGVDGFPDFGGVALCHRRAYQLVEGVAPGGVHRGLLPVHPALSIKPRSQTSGVQAARRIARAQVAHDDVGLVQGDFKRPFAIHHGGDAAVRVHRQVRGGVVAAKSAAYVDALKRYC